MTDPLSKLPIFATDMEIAVAIVGKQRASLFVRAVIPELERKGFPRIDALHDGRPVPLIRKFYEGYLGITAGFNLAAPDGREDLESWTRSKRDKRKDRVPQMGLTGRCSSVLRYMVAHPEAQTHPAIPNAGAFTMEQLATKGAIVEGKKDRDGDIVWSVTDAGHEEAKRINRYFGGKS